MLLYSYHTALKYIIFCYALIILQEILISFMGLIQPILQNKLRILLLLLLFFWDRCNFLIILMHYYEEVIAIWYYVLFINIS